MTKSNYFRHRLDKDLDTLAREYIGSYKEDKAIIDFDIKVNEAHTLMLYKQGIIEKSDAKKILEGLEIASKKKRDGNFEIKPDDIDVHLATERYVIEHAGLDIGGKLHSGKSRNDQVVTDIRLYTREQVICILNILFDFISSLAKTAGKYKKDIMPGYTHGQHAQVTTVGYYLSGYCQGFLNDVDRLLDAYERINLSPLGACALAGTSIKIDREYTAKLLGFDGIIENSMDAISNRDFATETLASIAIIMNKLSRMAEDLINFSAYEYSFVTLPDEYCDISSVMPQKKNPDVLEMIRTNAGKIDSILLDVSVSTLRLPTGYFKDLQPIKKSLIDAIEIVKSSITLMRGITEKLEFDSVRMKEVIDENYVTALDLAEYIVQNKNISFRESHILVGEFIKKLEKEKRKLKDLSPEEIEKISTSVLSRTISISKKELGEATDPLMGIERRNLTGPAPNATDNLLKSLMSRIKKKEENTEKIRYRLKSSEELFQKAKEDI